MGNFRFETESLFILDMTMDDCDFVASLWGDFEIGKYLSDPYYEDGNELRACFKNGELENNEAWTDDFFFVLVDKEEKIIIGTACLW